MLVEICLMSYLSTKKSMLAERCIWNNK